MYPVANGMSFKFPNACPNKRGIAIIESTVTTEIQNEPVSWNPVKPAKSNKSQKKTAPVKCLVKNSFSIVKTRFMT